MLLPTTGRPEMVQRCVQRLLETTEGHHLEIVAAVDCDDETVDRLCSLAPAQTMFTISETYRGCSKAWNDALAKASGDPVVFAADDLIWEDGWLGAALKKLAEFEDGWGLVGFNDGHWNADLSTHYLMSRRFIVEVLGGVVAWPFYRHSFNDLEVNQRARLAGRYAWAEDARVYHAHWLFGDRPKDDTDSRTLDEHGESQRIYQQRAAAGFPNDFEAVITS